MHSKEYFNNIIEENEEHFKTKYSNFEKEFISELYKDIDSINKKEFSETIEKVEKRYYDLLYPTCWNYRTLAVVEQLYEF